jgi:CheY-like chemotaxis protein
MPHTKSSLLIVDDESSIRFSLCCLLTEIGYRVRTAEDGFAALAEIRKEVPEILLSDLNMPGMSGFELLSVVRRRFPNLQTIAMSGAFAGDEVPSGVAADAFYQKGSSMASLLRIMENLPLHEHMHGTPSREVTPAWILGDGVGTGGEKRVTVSCPECLRTFSHVLNQSVIDAWQGICAHCKSEIHLAVVPLADLGREASARSQRASSSPAFHGLQTADFQ